MSKTKPSHSLESIWPLISLTLTLCWWISKFRASPGSFHSFIPQQSGTVPALLQCWRLSSKEANRTTSSLKSKILRLQSQTHSCHGCASRQPRWTPTFVLGRPNHPEESGEEHSLDPQNTWHTSLSPKSSFCLFPRGHVSQVQKLLRCSIHQPTTSPVWVGSWLY